MHVNLRSGWVLALLFFGLGCDIEFAEPAGYRCHETAVAADRMSNCPSNRGANNDAEQVWSRVQSGEEVAQTSRPERFIAALRVAGAPTTGSRSNQVRDAYDNGYLLPRNEYFTIPCGCGIIDDYAIKYEENDEWRFLWEWRPGASGMRYHTQQTTLTAQPLSCDDYASARCGGNDTRTLGGFRRLYQSVQSRLQWVGDIKSENSGEEPRPDGRLAYVDYDSELEATCHNEANGWTDGPNGEPQYYRHRTQMCIIRPVDEFACHADCSEQFRQELLATIGANAQLEQLREHDELDHDTRLDRWWASDEGESAYDDAILVDPADPDFTVLIERLPNTHLYPAHGAFVRLCGAKTAEQYQDKLDGNDQDGDRVCDQLRDGLPLDNCPGVHNQDQRDQDKDWRGDACDNCRTKKNYDQANRYARVGDQPCKIGVDCAEDEEGDACGDVDDDGVTDGDDNCPLVINPVADCDDDPDTPDEQCDRDNDGLGDACDSCPLVANADAQDGDADGDGIPDACDCLDDADVRVSVGDLCRLEGQPDEDLIPRGRRVCAGDLVADQDGDQDDGHCLAEDGECKCVFRSHVSSATLLGLDYHLGDDEVRDQPILPRLQRTPEELAEFRRLVLTSLITSAGLPEVWYQDEYVNDADPDDRTFTLIERETPSGQQLAADLAQLSFTEALFAGTYWEDEPLAVAGACQNPPCAETVDDHIRDNHDRNRSNNIEEPVEPGSDEYLDHAEEELDVDEDDPGGPQRRRVGRRKVITLGGIVSKLNGAARARRLLIDGGKNLAEQARKAARVIRSITGKQDRVGDKKPDRVALVRGYSFEHVMKDLFCRSEDHRTAKKFAEISEGTPAVIAERIAREESCVEEFWAPRYLAAEGHQLPETLLFRFDENGEPEMNIPLVHPPEEIYKFGKLESPLPMKPYWKRHPGEPWKDKWKPNRRRFDCHCPAIGPRRFLPIYKHLAVPALSEEYKSNGKRGNRKYSNWYERGLASQCRNMRMYNAIETAFEFYPRDGEDIALPEAMAFTNEQSEGGRALVTYRTRNNTRAMRRVLVGEDNPDGTAGHLGCRFENIERRFPDIVLPDAPLVDLGMLPEHERMQRLVEIGVTTANSWQVLDPQERPPAMEAADQTIALVAGNDGCGPNEHQIALAAEGCVPPASESLLQPVNGQMPDWEAAGCRVDGEDSVDATYVVCVDNDTAATRVLHVASSEVPFDGAPPERIRAFEGLICPARVVGKTDADFFANRALPPILQEGTGIPPLDCSSPAECDVEHVYGDRQMQDFWRENRALREKVFRYSIVDYADHFILEDLLKEAFDAPAELSNAIWYAWMWAARLKMTLMYFVPMVELRKNHRMRSNTVDAWPSYVEPGLYMIFPLQWWGKLEGGYGIFDKWNTMTNFTTFMHGDSFEEEDPLVLEIEHPGPEDDGSPGINTEAADLCID